VNRQQKSVARLRSVVLLSVGLMRRNSAGTDAPISSFNLLSDTAPLRGARATEQQ